MAVPWFFHFDIPKAGALVHLNAEEARHARGARRLQEGDHLCLFDGKGVVAPARVRTIEKKGRAVVVEVQSTCVQPVMKPAITVATAVPKGDRLSTLLNMTAQLGVATLVPIRCERSVAEGGQGLGERGKRIILEACKQARCAYAMTIAPPMDIALLLSDARQRGNCVWLADPAGEALPSVMHRGSFDAVTLMIGPEGGFTERELETAREAGASFVSLGSTILRIETACIALSAAIRLSSV